MPHAEFNPHLHQWDAIEATRRYFRVWLCGGIGSGKTHALVWWYFLMASQWAKGIDSLLFEPDLSTFLDVFLPVYRKEIPGEGTVWRYHHSNTGGHQIHCLGSTMYVRSAMNMQNVMRSEGLTTIGYGALDEPARMLCGAQAWLNTIGRCRVKIPGWSHNPILLVGSPRGLQHWTAEAFGCTTDHPEFGYDQVYEPSADPKHAGYAIRACRTADNAIYLADNYEANAKQAYSPALQAQEFGASLVSGAGLVFPEWSPQIHVIPNHVADRLWDERVISVFGGGDQGTTAPGASLIMGWTGDRECIIIDEWYKSGRTVIDQGVAMKALEAKWSGGTMLRSRHGTPEIAWYYDPSAAGTIELFRRGFEYGGKRMAIYCLPAKYHGSAGTHTGAPTGWEARVDIMRSMLIPRRQVRHPNPKVPEEAGCPRVLIAERCVNLRREMAHYRRKEQKIGEPPREGAVGDDHAIDSVCGAIFTTATSVEISVAA